MSLEKNIDWFKSEIAPTLTGYELKFKFFKKAILAP